MHQRDYYYGHQSEQFAFFRIPKLLSISSAYKGLSAEAKILYGLMLDRMALSQKNGWLDEYKRVYIIFTLEEIQEQLGCSHEKAGKLLAELDSMKGYGLIERVRRGLGLPSIIYIKNFADTASEEEAVLHNRDYYYGMQSDQFAFYRIPKLLFTAEEYKGLSAEAKILYGLMLDRMALSQKNVWLDEYQRVYIIFTLEEIQEQMGCSHEKAVKLLAELDSLKGLGLIERVKRGLGLPAIIYIKNFAVNTSQDEKSCAIIAGTPYSSKTSENRKSGLPKNRSLDFRKSELKTSEKQKSGLPENGTLDFRKSDAIKTNNNNTYMSDTESINLSIDREGRPMDGSAASDRVEKARRDVRTQIEYDILAEEENGGMLDEIVNIMMKMMLSRSKTVRIAGEDVDTALVKDAYARLRSGDIMNVISAYQAVEVPVANPTNYLRSMLFNAPDSGFLGEINRYSSRYSE